MMSRPARTTAKIFTKKSIIFIAVILSAFSAVTAWSASVPPVQRVVMPNELVLLVAEEHSLPFVVMQLLVNAGSRLDPAGKEGVAYLTAKGLMLGTPTKNATALNQAVDFMGASLGASATQDYAVVSLQVLKKELAEGFGLFMDVLTNPTFPEQEIGKETRKILGAIQARDEQPMALAEKTFRKTLFPKNPYGTPAEGTPESVSRLSAKDVSQFYRASYGPSGAILSIVGDITMEEVKTKLMPALGRWSGTTSKPGPINETYAKGPQTITINRQTTQANIVLGNIGVRRNDPDYYNLSVMNYILGGGGFGSRLMEEIRVKKGLAYSVSSFFDADKYQGSFQVVMQTKNLSARDAITLARKEIEQIRKELVSEDDLRRAKAYLVGSFPLRIDTQSKLAGFLAQVEYYGLGLDYPDRYPSLINSVTGEDVLRAGKEHLYPDEAILVVVGNLKEAQMETPSGEK